MKFKIVFLIVFAFIAQIVHAQKFGIKGGLNIAKYSSSKDMANIFQGPIAGFHVGPIVDYKIKGNFYINTGLIYSLKGYKTEIGIPNGMGDMRFETASAKTNGLDIPLYISCKFSLNNTSSFFIQGGPYLSYTLNGKIMDYDIVFDGLGNMERFDYGIGVGSGLQFGSWVTSVNYEFGLADRYDFPDSKSRNRVLQLSIAYMFGNKNNNDENPNN